MKQSTTTKKCLMGILALLAIAAYMATPNPQLPTAEWSLAFWESKAVCALCVGLLWAVNHWRTDND